MIKPEEIGFSPLDTEVSPAVKSPRDNPNRLADISVDLSEERRDRWVRYLTVIGLVSNDSEKRKAVVQQLADFIHTLIDRNEDENIIAALEYAKDVIVNFSQPAALKLVINRGVKENLLDKLVRIDRGFLRGAAGLTPDPLTESAIYYAIALPRELYAQNHGGEAYMTPEQRQDLDVAKARMEKTTIR